LDELMLKDNQNTEILRQEPSHSTGAARTNNGTGHSDSVSKTRETQGEGAFIAPPKNKKQNIERDIERERALDPDVEPWTGRDSGKGAHVEMRDQKDRRRRNFRLAIVGLIWGITLGLLALAAIFAYLNRQNMIDRYPESVTLYRAFGINVSAQGLAFDKPVTRSIFIDGSPVLIINGSVKNITTRTMPLPMVVLSLHNGAQEPLAEWRVEFPNSELAKGKRSEFVAQFPNPPIDAVHLRYRFDDGTTRNAVSVFEPVNSDAERGASSDPTRSNRAGRSIPVPSPATSREEAEAQREVEPIPMIVEE